MIISAILAKRSTMPTDCWMLSRCQHRASADRATMSIIKKLPMITGIASNPQIAEQSGAGGNGCSFRVNPSKQAMMDALGTFFGRQKFYEEHNQKCEFVIPQMVNSNQVIVGGIVAAKFLQSLHAPLGNFDRGQRASH